MTIVGWGVEGGAYRFEVIGAIPHYHLFFSGALLVERLMFRGRTPERRTGVHNEVAGRRQWYDVRTGHSDTARCHPERRRPDTVCVQRVVGQVDAAAPGGSARRDHPQRRTV